MVMGNGVGRQIENDGQGNDRLRVQRYAYRTIGNNKIADNNQPSGCNGYRDRYGTAECTRITRAKKLFERPNLLQIL